MLIVIFQVALLVSCELSEPPSSDDSLIDDGYVSLSISGKNTILKGKDIFDTVMKKYQPIMDYYGDNFEDFKALVNTNLLFESVDLVSPSAGLYNYDSMQAWGDTEFVVKYKDGTTETLPAAEILTISGSSNPEWFNNGKEVVNFFAKLEDAEKTRTRMIDALNKCSDKVGKINILAGLKTPLSTAVQELDSLSSLTTVLSEVGKFAGYFGAAFSLAESIGLFGSGPSTDEIILKKLDHIITLIEGMYTHLEYIENRLTDIELVVINEANKDIQLELNSIINSINGLIQELKIWEDLEHKTSVAMQLSYVINGYLQNYIDYSTVDYGNYLEYKIVQEKDPVLSPLIIQVLCPWKKSWADSNWQIHQEFYDQAVINIAINNPEQYLPFSFEGLDYLKNLLWTRLNINSFIETDNESLNAANSNTVLTYLANNSTYIPKLRNQLINAYATLTVNLKNAQDYILNNAQDNYFDRIIKYGLTNGGNYQPAFNDYPSIILGANTPIELAKGINIENDNMSVRDDFSFLEDCNLLLDAFYKGKSVCLMEFAASLAALEIQLSENLDDEDYKTYKNY